MIEVPELDDLTYHMMMQKAVSQIPLKTSEWTDYNYHDPGITVLQTYAWLVDMLNYYMNSTGEMHHLKFLKLIGIQPEAAKGARAYLNFSNIDPKQLIPKGTRIYAGKIPFETLEDASVKENKMISYINEINGEGVELEMFAGKDGDFAEMFSEDPLDQCRVYFGFESPLKGLNQILIEVEDTEQRNPFSDDFILGEFFWEYYGEDGWSRIEEIADDTCGFLKNGLITINTGNGTIVSSYQNEMKSAHYIRCSLKQNLYDLTPRLGTVHVNPVSAEQKYTVCRTESIEIAGVGEYLIPGIIDKNSRILVGLEQENGTCRILCDTHAQDSEVRDCRIISQKESFRKAVRLQTGKELEASMIETGRLKVIVIQQNFSENCVIGRTDGCADQKIHFNHTNCYHLQIATKYQQEEKEFFRQWSYTPDLKTAGHDEYVFYYDPQEHYILFGDGFHGVIPEQNEEILITELSTSFFENGNVRSGEIRSIQSPGFLEYQVWNPQAANGGRSRETLQDLMNSMQALLLKQYRLVTSDDYEDIVLNTPGLILNKIAVIPGRIYEKLYQTNMSVNEVVLAIQPYSPHRNPVLGELYKNKIAKHLEKQRLINTKVTLVSPSYVGIEVHAKITLHYEAEQEKESIQKFLKNQIETGKEGESEFGRHILISVLRMNLEMQDGVKSIEEFSLERIGRSAQKNEQGDILLYPDALPYVLNIQIEYTS